MKKLALCITLYAILSADLSAQYTSLTVQHPQLLKSAQGTIEQAVVAMTPHGTFMQYDVTMTFSARNTNAFQIFDSIEVNYLFPLPAESVVNDLWLWVGKELSRGLILDRATASSTYENIVKRRRDPAFLQKTSADQYKLQIYPMVASGSRTVKFTFHAPMKKTGPQWYAAVPGSLFRTSLVPLEYLRIIYYSPTLTHVPSVMNETQYGFTPWTDSLTRVAAWKCDVPGAAFAAADPVVAVPVPVSDGNMEELAGADGGYYHVVVDPFTFLGVDNARKFVVAFDYDSVKTTLLRSTYIESVKAAVKQNCTPADSFNVVFDDWQRSGEKWFAADSAGIAAAFKTLGAATIPTSSNIPGLLMNAIEFAYSRGGSAAIVLMAASDKLGAPASADPVLAWLRQRLPAGAVIHIADFQNRNAYTTVLNGKYYSGNRYFYEGVKAITGGMVRTPAYNEAPTAVLADLLVNLYGGLSSSDLQVRYENGFTHSKYYFGIAPFQSVTPGQLVGQIGKYQGRGPVTFELAGFYRGEPYSKKISVPLTSISPGDSSLRAIWVGKYIADIEWLYTSSADVVKQITDACIRERVVCRYTALLALEPGDTILNAKNDNPIKVTHASGTSGVPEVYAVAAAYPNPFNPSTTLRVRLPEGVSARDATMKIYNMLGQLVKTFDPAGVTSGSFTEYRWDAVDDAGRRAASGMYLFVVTTPGARHTVKLMLLK